MDLYELRKQQPGLTVQTVANQLGVTESTVRNWEKARSTPRLTPAQYRMIRAVYKCSVDEWLSAYEQTRVNWGRDDEVPR